jgi:flagellar hook assembly protein FlgD
VRTLVNEVQPAGYKSVRWDSRNNAGAEVPTGIYFYRLEATGTSNPHRSFVDVRKMVLAR